MLKQKKNFVAFKQKWWDRWDLNPPQIPSVTRRTPDYCRQGSLSRPTLDSRSAYNISYRKYLGQRRTTLSSDPAARTSIPLHTEKSYERRLTKIQIASSHQLTQTDYAMLENAIFLISTGILNDKFQSDRTGFTGLCS